MLTCLRSEETRLTTRFQFLCNNSPPKLKQVHLFNFYQLKLNASFETDYRIHLVERTQCAADSDYDTDDLIEDARNLVITAKRFAYNDRIIS